MGSKSEKLVIGRKYYLISESQTQSWNDGICVLDSIVSVENNRALVTKLNANDAKMYQINVHVDTLYELVKYICIKEGFGSSKIGDIIDWCTAKDYEYAEFREHFKPLAEFREERINQILE